MVFSVGCSFGLLSCTLDDVILFSAEIQEMGGSVGFVVEVLRVIKNQRESHILTEVDTIEVIVPDTTLRDHEETKELVRENHLDTFIEV